MEHTTPAVKTRKRAAPQRDALIGLLVSLYVRPCDLAAMIIGVTAETTDEWFAGAPIPPEMRPAVREAVRRFLADAEFILGQAAVRDPLFAASMRFSEFAGRLNKTRRQFEALED